MQDRALKNILYEQVARLGKALASAKRLELLEILCQGEKCVEHLATDAEISVKLASAHLKALRQAQLIVARRDGKHSYYRLQGNRVADLWVVLHLFARERLAELQVAMRDLVEHPEELAPVSGSQLLARARRGEVLVLDVRPTPEYDTAHLPYARSIPLKELKRRVNEIPKNKPIFAYCRGPFCLMAKKAVLLLKTQGYSATRLEEGVAEWRSAGLPLQTIA